MFRWKGIISFIIIVGLFVLLSFFFADQWLESAIENTASKANGAKVEIDGLHFSLFDVSLGWQRLRVTDPDNTMKNRFETGETTFDLEFWPLLSGKFVVEEMKMTNMATGTERTSDGKLEEEMEEPVNEEPGFFSETFDDLKKEAAKQVLPDFSSVGKKLDPKNIISQTELKSVKKMDSLKAVLERRYAYWDSVFKNTDIEREGKEIEKLVKEINVNEMKNAAGIQKGLAKIDKVRKKAEKLNKEYKELTKGAKADYAMLDKATREVPAWISEDYSSLYQMANLPDFSFEGMGKYLFGDAYIQNISEIVRYVKLGRSMLSGDEKKEAKEENPPRLKGQNIRFPQHRANPDYWIKKGALSGTLKEIFLGGSVSDIVSSQKLIGRPTIIKLSGEKDKSKIDINAEFNYLGDIPKEKIKIDLTGISLNNYKLGNSSWFPKKIVKGVGNLQSSFLFSGNTFKGKISFTASGLTFPPADKGLSKIQKIIDNTIRKVKEMSVLVSVTGEKGKVDIKVTSSLDKTLKKAFSESIQAEVEALKKKIRKEADKQIKKREEELNRLIAKYRKDLEKNLGKYGSVISSQEKEIDKKKKELEKKLGSSGKDLEKKLKNLIKF